MSENVDVFPTDHGGQRERPFLYPWNRKLRHLQGISIRNLNIAPNANRSSRKNITDDDASYRLKSPTKRCASDTVKDLQRSRSSTDLNAPTDGSPRPSNLVDNNERNGSLASRPALGKIRRRSTLHWTGATPGARQKRLEDVTATRMADTWFSLHDKTMDEPLYISEVMERSMNPSFRLFDLEASDPAITQSDELTLKVWAKANKADHYLLLTDVKLSLRSLQYIGRTLENFHHPLPQNCVLFHFSDGIYTSFTDLSVEEDGHVFLSEVLRSGHIESTSSYDALMQLANLDDCIHDALEARKTLEAQINMVLAASKNHYDLRDEKNQRHFQQRAVESASTIERKHVRQMTKRKDDLRRGLQLRREAMSSRRQTQIMKQDATTSFSSRSKEVLSDLGKAGERSSGQLRRICEDLLQVYPIEPLKNRTLQFSIRGIHLPNSVFDDTNRDEIAAALGSTSSLVFLLSLYLSAPLPYPITVTAGTPYIRDPVSIAISQRNFPLEPTNVAYKFEYGVFLLNKDIEFLMSKVGLRMLDIRHSLPNLKYLTYVLTAGTGEMPSRKAGGVRGLTGGRTTPSMSRRGSDESMFSNQGYTVKHAGTAMGKNGSILVPGRTKERLENDLDDPLAASPRSRGIPFRSSLLRDFG